MSQVPPADLDIPVLSQLALAQLPLSSALEPGPLEVVRLDAPLRRGRLGQEPLEPAEAAAANGSAPFLSNSRPIPVQKVGDRAGPCYAGPERSDPRRTALVAYELSVWNV
jgi:hypothetical protein